MHADLGVLVENASGFDISPDIDGTDRKSEGGPVAPGFERWRATLYVIPDFVSHRNPDICRPL